jgi:hypothetical protein
MAIFDPNADTLNTRLTITMVIQQKAMDIMGHPGVKVIPLLTNNIAEFSGVMLYTAF